MVELLSVWRTRFLDVDLQLLGQDGKVVILSFGEVVEGTLVEIKQLLTLVSLLMMD